jgi:hypothetical protein
MRDGNSIAAMSPGDFSPGLGHSKTEACSASLVPLCAGTAGLTGFPLQAIQPTKALWTTTGSTTACGQLRPLNK